MEHVSIVQRNIPSLTEFDRLNEDEEKKTTKTWRVVLQEKVQKRATKILPGLKNLTYSERLKICKIPTLHYRRIRGDMIETYKIVSGKYQPDVAPTLCKSSVHVTRGNDMRLEKSSVKYDLRKFSFSNWWWIYMEQFAYNWVVYRV